MTCPRTVNLHAHTWRCNHASGTEREYIELAVKAGYKTFGFSDHTPMPFKDGHKSTFRMRVDQQKDYVETILALREEYKGQIEIPIGYEAEYYPALFHDLIKLLTSMPVDYLIQGQHALDNESSGRYSGITTEDPNYLHDYVSQTIEGMETGVFTYLAHPDLCGFVGDHRVFDHEYGRLIEKAVALSMPLEINQLGLFDGRYYPHDRFWHLAGEAGAIVVLGCDTHQPQNVFNERTFQQACALVDKYNLQVIEKPALRPVKG